MHLYGLVRLTACLCLVRCLSLPSRSLFPRTSTSSGASRAAFASTRSTRVLPAPDRYVSPQSSYAHRPAERLNPPLTHPCAPLRPAHTRMRTASTQVAGPRQPLDLGRPYLPFPRPRTQNLSASACTLQILDFARSNGMTVLVGLFFNQDLNTNEAVSTSGSCHQ